MANGETVSPHNTVNIGSADESMPIPARRAALEIRRHSPHQQRHAGPGDYANQVTNLDTLGPHPEISPGRPKQPQMLAQGEWRQILARAHCAAALRAELLIQQPPRRET